MLARQWTIVGALGATRYGLSVGQIEERTGASRATVYRDLAVLEESGIPIVVDGKRGEARYRLARPQELPTLAPTGLELAALHLARAELEPLAGTAMVEELDALLGKLRPPKRQQSFRFKERPKGRPGIVKTLERAIQGRRRARLEYRAASRGGAPSTVHVEPYVLNVADGETYVHGYCVERGAERTYKVSRIERAELTGEASARRGRRPGGEIFGRSVKTWVGQERTVRVRLDADVAWLAREYPLLGEQTVERGSDGSVVVEARVAGILEASRWVLSWGGSAEVLGPAELRALVAEEVGKALGKYRLGVGPVRARGEKTTGRALRRLAQGENGGG